MYKENPAYIYENTFRLIIVGLAISSFCTMVFVDVLQLIFTALSLIVFQIKRCWALLKNNEGVQNKKVSRPNSTIIVSNL